MKASQKKIFSALICAVLLLSAGCKNVPDETSANLADERTTSETSTTETTAFETTEAVIRPDLFPKDIWTYQFECAPLPENVNQEDIVLTLGGPVPNKPDLRDGELVYYSAHIAFEVTVKNNSTEPINVYNLIFLEQYISPGKTDKVEYYNGWKRIPYDYSNYFAEIPAKTTLLPGEETVLTFHNDICVRYHFPGFPDAQGSFIGDFQYTPGKYRLAVYMDGGVRYVEFPLIVKRYL